MNFAKALAPNAPWIPYSYAGEKVAARLSGEGKPGNAGNLATDTASTFGIKLKAIDKNFTRAMQQNDRAFRMRALTASMRSIRRQFQNRQISREEYEVAMARARAKIQRIKETCRGN